MGFTDTRQVYTIFQFRNWVQRLHSEECRPEMDECLSTQWTGIGAVPGLVLVPRGGHVDLGGKTPGDALGERAQPELETEQS